MKLRDSTDRILVVGAAGFSVCAASLSSLLAWGVVQSVWDWRSWARLDTPNQWFQLPFGVLFIFIPLAVSAAIWRRVISRRCALDNASTSIASRLTPRSKYAVWSLTPPKNGRNALPARKKIGRS